MSQTVQLYSAVTRWFGCVAGLGMTLACPVTGQETTGLKSEIRVLRVERQGSRENLIESREAEPGDFFEYRICYRNTGQQTIRNFTPTLPIPNPMIYVANSATPAKVSATLDTRRFLPIPLTRDVQLNGSIKKARVSPSEYRALRWSIGPLAPGQSVVLSARVQLPIARRYWRRDLVA